MEMRKYLSELKEQLKEHRFRIMDAEQYSLENGYDAEVSDYLMGARDPENIFREAWTQFGDLQYTVMNEELAEMIVAISKLRRGGASANLIENVAEEEADVLIMLAQLNEKYPALHELVERKYEEKLLRLHQRLASGYYSDQVKNMGGAQ